MPIAKKEWKRREDLSGRLMALGFTRTEANDLRRISNALRRWAELECGSQDGAIERDETTGKPYLKSAMSGRRWPTPDREKGALARLNTILARHAPLRAWIQGDPRGVALYIIRPGDVPAGKSDDAYYSRGLAVM